MTMDKEKSIAAMEVERCSKLGTLRLQQGFPDKAMEAYRSAYKNAQTISNQGYMLRACSFNLGAILISTGNYIEGLAYLNKSIPPEGKRDGRSNGDLHFNYGLAYEGLKNIAKARQHYETALNEYKTEHENVKMEADTVSRISRLCLETNQLSEANDWMKHLTSLYANQGQVEKELQTRVERSNLLLKMGRAQEAEEVADECFKILENTTPSVTSAKTYSDLSVAYTQILHYDKAVTCSEKALPLVEDANGDPRLAAVLYQNLGAIYNYMGRFDDAVKYHNKACSTYAKLQMRANQGHCFTNMGYAYSQTKEMDKAGECFLHGLQAARDSGDYKTECQNLEALASVAYHKKFLLKAQQYYQQAISVLAKSPEMGDGSVHERLMTKLKNVITAQTQSPRHPTAPSKENINTLVRRASTNKENVNLKDLKGLASHMENGDLKVIRKGSQVRYLKVRRSGTLRRFQKFALGLDPPMNDSLVENEAGEDDHDSHSDKSNSDDSSSEDEEDDEEEDDADAKNKIKEEESKRTRAVAGARPPDSYLPRDSNRNLVLSDSEVNGSVEQLDTEDDSDDEAQVKRLMQQQLSDDNKDGLGRSTKRVDADEQDDESSETDSSEEEIKERLKPPVPSLSPQTTGEKSLRTYENPEALYESIQQKPPPGHNAPAGPSTEDGGFTISSEQFASQPTDSHGVNYFHEEKGQLYDEKDSPLAPGEPSSSKEESTIYESIRPRPSTSQAAQDSDGNDVNSDEEEMVKMSRGEKDIVMYREFQSAKSKEREDGDSETGNQKNSSSCIVM